MGGSKRQMGGPPARPQRRLDRSKSAAAGALKGLHLATKYANYSWPDAEKRIEALAVDGLLLRIRFGKCIVFSPSVGGDGLSQYRIDFHELEQIGYGNFSRVFKVLKRIDGCLYAVKQSTKHLHNETERKRALMEVQAMATLAVYKII